MRQIFWTLAALASHWRKHPANLATLILGLAIATALWSGVQALNTQARRSYDSAANAFTGGKAQNLVAAQGGLFAQDLFVALRRAGMQVSPILEGSARIGKKTARLIGIEPLTLPHDAGLAPLAGNRSATGMLTGDGLSYAAPETIRDLGVVAGERPVTDAGFKLPPLVVLSEAPPGAIVVDIGVAQKALNRPARLSRMIVAPEARIDEATLRAATDRALRIVEPEEDSDLARLTDSFHLNLTAFGLLAFLVGFFIVHASFGLAFEERLPVLRTLRALGVSARALVTAMLIELSVFTLLAGGAGVIGGYLIAVALLPDVSASLEGLYGAQISGALTLDARWIISALAMAGGGALFAGASGLLKTFNLPVLSVARPVAWREAHRRYLFRQAIFALLSLMIAALASRFADTLEGGFTVIAATLLGVALLLPLALEALLRIGEALSETPLSRWFFADGRQEIAGLSLALMALLLALATNIGVGGMVEGFRRTFIGWLDQRLVAEIYYEAATPHDAREIENWARTDKEIVAILPVWRSKTRIGDWPVEVMGMTPHTTYSDHFPLNAAKPGVWRMLHEEDAALVSEQLARRLKLSPGDSFDLPTTGDSWRLRVAGIFPDYGNPKGQIRLDHTRLAQHFADASGVHYSLRVAHEATTRVMTRLQETFGARIARIVDQAEVKKISTEIFERTFTVTSALNTLTLVVSAIALFASLLTLSNLRLAHVAPVWAIGVTRARLATLELLRILVFAAGAALIAIPLGLFMTWALVDIVNVVAFGWRLPMHIFPRHWLTVFATAQVAALVAGLAPVRRLARTAPAELLKVFANER